MAVLLKHAGWVCVRFFKNADKADEVSDHHTFKNLISKIGEYRVQMNYKTGTARRSVGVSLKEAFQHTRLLDKQWLQGLNFLP